MKEFEFTVRKDEVLEEVMKTASYIAAKNDSTENGKTYETVFAADEDKEQLQRFWNEACQAMTLVMKRFVKDDVVVVYGDDYTVNVFMDDSFKDAFSTTINETLKSFAIETVLAKWLSLMPLVEQGNISAIQSQRLAMAETHKENLREALRVHQGIIRRKMKPF